MKILLTLDYELFLGLRTGSVEKCLVEPMHKLLQKVDAFDAKFTLFADAAYLYKLKALSGSQPALKHDLQTVTKELQTLVKAGHDVQLHIHPQWYYSTFDGNNWTLDQQHYKLTDVPKEEAAILFKDSKALLDEIVGYKTHAFRAGGFSAQPFEDIKPLFLENGITVDSSACPGTRYNSDHQQYDYLGCPQLSRYTFEDDLAVEAREGRFTEIPLNMYPVSPTFYWRLVLTRLLKSKKHLKIGDGDSVKTATDSIVERLTRHALSLSTIDGLKISYLYDSLRKAEKRGDELFCVIGHPKLATPYSIEALGRFCSKAVKDGHQFTTIANI